MHDDKFFLKYLLKNSTRPRIVSRPSVIFPKIKLRQLFESFEEILFYIVIKSKLYASLLLFIDGFKKAFFP